MEDRCVARQPCRGGCHSGQNGKTSDGMWRSVLAGCVVVALAAPGTAVVALQQQHICQGWGMHAPILSEKNSQLTFVAEPPDFLYPAIFCSLARVKPAAAGAPMAWRMNFVTPETPADKSLTTISYQHVLGVLKASSTLNQLHPLHSCTSSRCNFLSYFWK